MLPGTNRLKKKNDFERVFHRGRGAKEGFLTLRFVKNNLDITRFGFIVGQKVSKKATIRNLVKRRLREAAKASLGRMKKGVDVVLAASKGAELKSAAETGELLNRLLGAAKLFHD